MIKQTALLPRGITNFMGHIIAQAVEGAYQPLWRRTKKSIMNKRGKIPWELAIDDIATELGFRSDQALANAVEACLKKMKRVDAIRARLPRRSKIKAVTRREPVCDPRLRVSGKCLNPKVEGKSCRYREKQCVIPAEKGKKHLDIVAVRHPSQHSIHVVKSGGSPGPDNRVGTVRYARDADKTLSQIGKAYDREYGRRPTTKKKVGR